MVEFVPEWVARGTVKFPPKLLTLNPDFRWQDVPPRFELRGRERAAPQWARGMSRYHQTQNANRCVLPVLLLDTFLDADGALVQLMSQISTTKLQFDEYMGAKGSNDQVRNLMESAAVAWDWSHLLFHKPLVCHVEAFLRILALFRQLFIDTERPNFPYVTWPWPTDSVVAPQYLLLLKRIRNKEYCEHCFTDVSQVILQRLRFQTTTHSIIAGISRQVVLQRLRFQQRKFNDHIMWLIFSFLNGGTGPSVCGDQFLVAPGALCLPGWARRVAPRVPGRQRNLAMSYPKLKEGCVVAIASGPLQGSLARVCKLHRRADATSIHAAIDLDQSLNAPGPSGHCWNAALVSHMCRLQLPSEAPCERWGSLLHNSYDPVQGANPERSACRLFLKEAGLSFVGAERDETFVDAVCGILEQRDGDHLKQLRALSNRARECVASGLGIPLSSSIQNIRSKPTSDAALITTNGSSSVKYKYRAYKDKQYRNTYRPTQLSERENEVLRHSMGMTASKQLFLDAHPRINPIGAHAKRKSLAVSVSADLLKEWLNSDKGQLWGKQREELLNNPDAEECADEDEV